MPAAGQAILQVQLPLCHPQWVLDRLMEDCWLSQVGQFSLTLPHRALQSLTERDHLVTSVALRQLIAGLCGGLEDTHTAARMPPACAWASCGHTNRQAVLSWCCWSCCRGCWRQLFLEVPHVRFDGVYASRNTYIRQGAVELRREKTVHLVTYFRYFRFFPDGSLLYRTSPLTIKQVVKTLLKPSCPTKGQHRNEQFVYHGKYVIKVGQQRLVTCTLGQRHR